MGERRELLARIAERIAAYREELPDAPVFPDPSLDYDAIRSALGGLLPEEPSSPARVVDLLCEQIVPALVASAGPRYFGFVTGGTLDAALGADLMAAGWDQNAFNAVTSPGASLVEEITASWLKEVLALPTTVSVGFVTGGQGANTVALAAARHHVLAAAGWDVERNGLFGAPRLRVVASVERHATIDRALRLLGLGTAVVEGVPSRPDGSIDAQALCNALEGKPAAPTIVCLQAGNVNTGAFDDFVVGCNAARAKGAWVHVDGAFGLWARACPSLAALTNGIELADSWACDGHKWLNVPYDSGYVFCAHPHAHRAAMTFNAAYLSGHGTAETHHPADFVPESSRRARGFATWAALRQLGKRGVADLVERSCALARRFATKLTEAEIEGVVIGTDVVINQVLVHFTNDTMTERMIAAVQNEGTAWLGGTTWQGKRYMRISVSNATTTEADVDRAVKVMAAIHERVSRGDVDAPLSTVPAVSIDAEKS